MSMKAYKSRLYSTEQQIEILGGTPETRKHLYNDSLERRVDLDVGFYEQKQPLTLRKQDSNLKQVQYSQVLQDTILRLDTAYQALFKKKGQCNSFTYPQHNNGWKIRDSIASIYCIRGRST